MKRINSVTDALNTNKVQVDVGDGIVIPLPTDGVFGGEQGPAGVGIPTGGTSGQVVQKTASGTIWATPSKDLVGLTEVDNTADIEKPLSEPQALALTTKADLIDGKVPASQVPIDDLGTSFIARRGTRGQVRRIYVRADGNDANDGKSAASAYREIRAAVESLSMDGPILLGSIIVDVGAGTYKAFTLPAVRGTSQDDFLKIIGPAVGHPNAPVAVVDHAADPTRTSGIAAADGSFLWLQDIKIQGPFSIGVDIRRNCYLQWRNVHVDGAATGLNVINRSHYSVTGGRIENCVTGIGELFGVVRDFSTVSRNEDQLTITNCTTAVKAKENCVGHFDYLNVVNNQSGFELQLYSGANMKSVNIKRTGVGITLTNSEIHNENSIIWGTGADANTRRILSLGSSSELALIGWTPVGEGSVATLRTGHRPLVTLAAKFDDLVVSGTTTETTVATFASLLRADWYAIQGKRARFVVWGTVETPLTEAYRVLLRIGGNILGEVAIPSGVAASSHFVITFEMVASSDGASQKVLGTVQCRGTSGDTYVATRSLDLTAADRGVNVNVIPGSTSARVTFKLVEVWG